ncbi:Crp/Fnr family transcriptional regulator [Thermithiobacillus plumbiphilus]|uniref:Crp/Fnr family transcriptional regulator n=1 Tax=Thermithiobacillus plumbiphilus TaxID=1729899 RepID=A0ABU9D834_9PROT
MSRIKLKAILSNIALFRELSAEDIEQLVLGTREQHLVRGELLFQKGSQPQGFYIVVHGQIKLAFSTPQGAEKVIDIVRAGQSFGEAAMFLDTPYLVYTQAITDTLLLHISKSAVFEEIEKSSLFARRMLAGVCRRLHGIVRDVEAYSLHSGTERVIGYLLTQDRDGEENGGGLRVRLPASKHVIASRLNISPETFSRILHELSAADLLSVNGREILVHDPARLRNYSVAVSR